MRRHDLDWLRVIVFALLIFYHVGMFFVPWGWHLKNNEIYEELRWPMLFLNQWRLPILFVISGMGTYYALGKRNGRQFSLERIKRLFLPLVFGMIFIVPPQIYMERLANHQFSGSYFKYWPIEAFAGGAYPAGNVSWHHLWFLPYLLIFSLTLLPLFLRLRKHPNAKILVWLRTQTHKTFGLYWFLIPLYIIEALVEPFFEVTHALIDDWFTIINFMTLFLFGFLLISIKDVFWTKVESQRRLYLYIGITSFLVQLGIWVFLEDSVWVHFTEAFIKVLNYWSWILVLFGYASKYLNKPSNLLSYANEAVYPFYILHQTITIVLAYYLMDLPWGLLAKAFILILGTFGISWIIYEFLIRRWAIVRPLFGLKKRSVSVKSKANTYAQAQC